MNLPFTIRSSSCRMITASALSLLFVLPFAARALPVTSSPQVQLADGALVGDRAMAGLRQLNVFRGIPYAAPPIGADRWREPQRLAPWAGVREAKQFAPRCMQMAHPDIVFRSQRMSEDCLYLNVWAPATTSDTELPVLVYFHGGGFAFGDGSEPRYDGSNLAARGMIVVTVNYRLGAFGFLTHPDASADGTTGAAGNYGLLDQQAALRWVRDNIVHFGGDPARVTIGGETTGAMAVSAHMASPSSRGLFARAIGESGGAFSPNAFWTRTKAERIAQAFATRVGANSLAALRSMSADKLQQAMGTYTKPEPFFWPTVDGHFLTDTPAAVFEAGGQAPVPLLVGSNSQERHFRTVYGPLAITPENWAVVLEAVFRNESAQARRLYPGNDADEIVQSASTLANDLSIGHSTWRWMDLHRKTSRAPVYFYLFTHARPTASTPPDDATAAEPASPNSGAPHRSEIAYVFDNLDLDRRYPGSSDDPSVARIFSGYIEQFVKTGNPNAINTRLSTFANIGRLPNLLKLPSWPAVREERDGLTRQVIDTRTHTILDASAERQALVDRVLNARPGD